MTISPTLTIRLGYTKQNDQLFDGKVGDVS